MSFNKTCYPHTNGFINILFHKAQSIEAQQSRGKDQTNFNRFIEQHVFIPRNKVKHVRILKINDTIYTNFNTLKAQHLKRMFVDGSHVKQLTPIRQIGTHHDGLRKSINREMSDSHSKRHNITKRHLSFYEDKAEMFEINQEEKETPKIKSQKMASQQLMAMSLQEKDLQGSTTSSSNRNIRISFLHTKRQKKKQPDVPKQMAVELKKQLLRFYSNPPCSPQNISAKSYIVYEHLGEKNAQYSHKCLHAAFNSKINLEIASLTKIMTCILALEICEKAKVDITTASAVIDSFETKVEGTSAELQPDESYTIQQLFYGMMLPSGNDASLAISALCGQLLHNNKGENTSQQLNKKYYSKKFVMEMNKKCNEIGMKRTIYSNSHGLANILNKSCASDLVILIDYSLRNPTFRKIVGSKSFECIVSKRTSEHKVKKRSIKWENTHKLIINQPDLYFGIKTGTTDAAGPCLASLVSTRGREFIIVVLNSKSSKWRYRDTQQLREWLWTKQKLCQIQQ